MANTPLAPDEASDEQRRWTTRHRVPSGVTLSLDPRGTFDTSVSGLDGVRDELSLEEVGILWLFVDAATPQEVVEVATDGDDAQTTALADRVRLWIRSGLLIPDTIDSPPARLVAFRRAVEQWRQRHGGAFPLLSPVPTQRPLFYYPGLTAQEFHESDRFAWCDDLARHVDVIRAEAVTAIADRRLFKEVHRLYTSAGRWAGAYLWVHGERVEETCRQCPKTAALLEGIPGVTEFGTAFLSALAPRTRVAPHAGNTNAKLRCQLPLVVPGEAALRVGDATRILEPGGALVFDDSFVHSSWNDSDYPRLVLVFDFFHPDLTAEEIGYLTTMWEEIEPPKQYADLKIAGSFPPWLAI